MQLRQQCARLTGCRTWVQTFLANVLTTTVVDAAALSMKPERTPFKQPPYLRIGVQCPGEGGSGARSFPANMNISAGQHDAYLQIKVPTTIKVA
mmetsp:Transcript_7774/g.19799  ORF Transcript_7774/g.19799 Transcript_7774/m.19799 type:complete len:94 (+) Transcript_7774:630-911(+)